jgi:hypothetical protein
MSTDKLIVQAAITVRVPEHINITKRVLDEVMMRVVNGQEIPPNVEVRGIFWRNPNRHGTLGYWRYHEGADLSAAPTDAPLESSPRGSLQDAIATLSPFLATGAIEFL